MAYVASDYDKNASAPLGKWAGDGQCVSYAKAVIPGLPITKLWKKGASVKSNKTIQKGTLIATFSAEKHYQGHAAIYEAQDDKGISVVDQWMTPPPRPVHRRVLRFGAKGNSNNGDNFFVVD